MRKVGVGAQEEKTECGEGGINKARTVDGADASCGAASTPTKRFIVRTDEKLAVFFPAADR
jgi:hypothetical protein